MAVLFILLVIVQGVDRQLPAAEVVSIRGVVQDTSCTPLPGVRVSGSYPASTAVTDEQGRFEVHVRGVKESIQLQATLAGFRTVARLGISNTNTWRHQVLTTDVDELAHADPVLSPGGPVAHSPMPEPGLRGEILTATCTPIANADVHLVQTADGSELRTTSDARGRFAFDSAVPGTYLLEVSADAFLHVHRLGTKIRPDGTAPLRVLMDDAANGVVDITLARDASAADRKR